MDAMDDGDAMDTPGGAAPTTSIPSTSSRKPTVFAHRNRAKCGLPGPAGLL
jgi:hypothetical protein